MRSCSNSIIRECLIYIALMGQGHFLKDRAVIVVYMLLAPWRYLFKMTGKQYRHSLLRPVTLKNADGLFFCGRSFTSCKAVSWFYEKDMREHVDLRHGVFVDIGAHIGKYTVRLARKLGDNGQVVAIEPEKNNFNVLKKNVKLNRLSNIHLVNAACSDRDGESPLYVVDQCTTLHSLYANNGKEQVIVKSLTLDTVLSQLNIERVDLVKIDVEGAEVDVIRGSTKALREYHPKIIFEAWNGKHLQETASMLKPFNYEITPLNDENYLAH
ncbi:MAG: FkbM family methyltransferase [Thermodesulfobacteriota bacterium]|nr:FkbM family methyltransferase [Thermodesulfobacteriota bacterium]